MVNTHNEHVVARENGWWAVLHETGERASRLFDNEHDAIDHARMLARRHNACIVVHNSEGRFRFVQCRDEIPANEMDFGMHTPMMGPITAPSMEANSNANNSNDGMHRIYQVTRIGDVWAVVVNEDRDNAILFLDQGSAMLYAYRMAWRYRSCVRIENRNGVFVNRLCPPDSPTVGQRIRMNLGM